MSLPGFLVGLALAVSVAACGSSPPKSSDEPTTAREKQLREAKAKGELDRPRKSWGKWRYSGQRDACFYSLRGRCFKTRKAACRAARCKRGTTCETEGAGPARVRCE